MATKRKSDDTKKSAVHPLAIVGIGCFILVVLLSVASFFAAGWIAKQMSLGALSTLVAKKTGIQATVENGNGGSVRITDPKTGATVDISQHTIPPSFPKDFPLYPNAKVTSALSGSDDGSANSLWLTLSSTESVSAVQSYYAQELKKAGWTAEATAMMTGNGAGTMTVTKADMKGTVTITEATTGKETLIVIVLGKTAEK